ncbi:MAG TPA: S8 family serine peptidase [Candidatus Eremiobacteraceae bacterium]|nr:S8 family serine peptidase [Candidatus Eremiobacteraceae bacterium]
MKHRSSGSWFVFALVAAASVASMANSCNGKSSSSVGPTPPPGPTPLTGCNAGATSIQIAGEEASFSRRLPGRQPRQPYVPGELAVKFTGTGSEPEVAAAMARVRAVQVQPPSELGYAVYSIPQTQDPAAAAASLAGTRGIAEAKPLMARYLQDIPDDVDFGTAAQLTSPQTVNPVQWDMYAIQMPATWTNYKGSAAVTIAIIDTGYDANNVDICSKVVNSAVFDKGGGALDTAGSAQDMDGHGSNVSGIAASVTNNVTRFAGVGWNTDLLEVRVFPTPTVSNPSPTASNLDIAAGINWAVANGAKVINLSLGAQGTCDTTEGNAINAALGKGVVVVVASGNDGLGTIDAPADCPGVIAVGATALDDINFPSNPPEVIAGYSNWGTNQNGLTLVAPGGDPCINQSQSSCTPSQPPDYLQWITNNYSTTAHSLAGHGIFIAGTSQATPHVSGVAALMLTKNPALTSASVKVLLQTYATDIGNPVKQGAGLLNATATLQHT